MSNCYPPEGKCPYSPNCIGSTCNFHPDSISLWSQALQEVLTETPNTNLTPPVNREDWIKDMSAWTQEQILARQYHELTHPDGLLLAQALPSLTLPGIKLRYKILAGCQSDWEILKQLNNQNIEPFYATRVADHCISEPASPHALYSFGLPKNRHTIVLITSYPQVLNHFGRASDSYDIIKTTFDLAQHGRLLLDDQIHFIKA